jgi:hypothetical protein
MHALAPNTPTTPSDETTGVFSLLHPLVEVGFPLLFMTSIFKIEVTLD